MEEKKTFIVKNLLIFKSLENICEKLIMAETDLNNLDTGSGDGDCGSTLSRGAQAIKKELNSIEDCGLPVNHPAALMRQLGDIVEKKMGGSSGALYSLFLSGAAKVFNEYSEEPTFQVWCRAFSVGLERIMTYGCAKPGDRTMVDPLYKVQEIFKEQNVFDKDLTLEEKIKIFALAVEAAEETAESTKNMEAKAGRASYVNKELCTKPDPGAVGIALLLRAILQAVYEKKRN